MIISGYIYKNKEWFNRYHLMYLRSGTMKMKPITWKRRYPPDSPMGIPPHEPELLPPRRMYGSYYCTYRYHEDETDNLETKIT
jgi:hypothetical protein